MGKHSKRYQLWYDSHELNQVVLKLFSKELDEQQFALNILIGWKARKESKFPAAMDATIHLMNAHLQQCYMNNGQIPLNETSLEALFGFAIIRFINVIADKAQKGQYKMAMKKAANQFGIPEYMVEMRHDLTHYHIQSISSLRHATLNALLWLRDNYWCKLQGSDGHPPSRKMDHRIKINLKKYQILKQSTFQNHKTHGSFTLDLCLKKLEFLIAKCPISFMKILATPRNLLSSKSRNSYFIDNKSQGQQDLLELSDDGVKIWNPIFDLVIKNNLLPQLVDMLLLSQGRFGKEADAEIITWVQYLLTLGEEASLIWDWWSLLRIALKHPSKPVLSLLPTIFENMDPPLCPSKQSQLVQVVSYFVGAATMPDNDKRFLSGKVYAPEDVQRLIHSKFTEGNPVLDPSWWTWNPGPGPLLGTFNSATRGGEELLQPEELPVSQSLRTTDTPSTLSLADPVLQVPKTDSKKLRGAFVELLGHHPKF